MLFAEVIFLIAESPKVAKKSNQKFEPWRSTQESNGFRKSRSKQKPYTYKFSQHKKKGVRWLNAVNSTRWSCMTELK